MSPTLIHRLTATAVLAGSLALSGVAEGHSMEAKDRGAAAGTDRVATLLHSLNERLLANTSATLTLDAWCAEQGIAPPGTRIVAERVKGQDRAADEAVRDLLDAGPDTVVAYRRVRLVCGDTVLSEADNWYLPSLLTPDMNKVLEETNTSFGRVVSPLGFTRETLDWSILWDGERVTEPPYVIRHRARLHMADGRPFSALVENYTDAVLGDSVQLSPE